MRHGLRSDGWAGWGRWSFQIVLHVYAMVGMWELISDIRSRQLGTGSLTAIIEWTTNLSIGEITVIATLLAVVTADLSHLARLLLAVDYAGRAREPDPSLPPVSEASADGHEHLGLMSRALLGVLGLVAITTVAAIGLLPPVPGSVAGTAVIVLAILLACLILALAVMQLRRMSVMDDIDSDLDAVSDRLAQAGRRLTTASGALRERLERPRAH